MSDTVLAAIEAAYRDRYPDFARTAAAIAGSREAGADAVHDAFVSAIRARSRYRGDSPLEAWLWRIVVNAALKRRRDVGRAGRPPALDEPWVDARSDDGDLRAAVAALPERRRLAIFLRYYADLDYTTIAAVMGVKVGTVGAELHAAQAALRSHLEEVPSHG